MSFIDIIKEEAEKKEPKEYRFVLGSLQFKMEFRSKRQAEDWASQNGVKLAS